MSSVASERKSAEDGRPSPVAGDQLVKRSSALATVSGDLPASTFEMRPNPRNSFKGAQVKEIVNEVLNEILHGSWNVPKYLEIIVKSVYLSVFNGYL